MPIQFNGTGLMINPTTAMWVDSDSVGISGDGHAIYPALREFRLSFNLTSQGEWYELYSYFKQVSVTGTLVASLPNFDSNIFTYREYSGAILRFPTMSQYFNEEWSNEVSVSVFVRT